MTAERRQASLPPAQPSYIFRGHAAQIHSVQIVRQNTRLVTGDADGWIVYWKLESKRPVAVWRAHDAAILGTGEWGSDKALTHGRDSTLRIWQLRITDEPNLSTVLPADGSAVHRPKPWLLHTLPVNTLNFCAFSMCHERHEADIEQYGLDQDSTSHTRLSDSILVAVPARDDKKIEVYQFPEEKLIYVVPRVDHTDTGMVMAVKLAHHQRTNKTILIAGYEGGFTAVHILGSDLQYDSQKPVLPKLQLAQTIYLSQPHSQPVLSLDASPDGEVYFTSSADAVIAAHRIPELPLNIDDHQSPLKAGRSERSSVNLIAPECSSRTTQTAPTTPGQDLDLQYTIATKDADNKDLLQRHESSSTPDQPKGSLGTTGADQAAGLLTFEKQTAPTESMESVPVDTSSAPLSFSKQEIPSADAGTSSLSFPKQQIDASSPSASSSTAPLQPSGLSTLFSSAPPQPKIRPDGPSEPNVTVQPAHKAVQTKHAGQQSLHVRSDGRLLVTGGWDSRVRIYSTKTLKEVAILKWHNDGVYATSFSELLDEKSLALSAGLGVNDTSVIKDSIAPNHEISTASRDDRSTGLTRLQMQRERQIQTKHWVVAGAKDGKVSLWEVF